MEDLGFETNPVDKLQSIAFTNDSKYLCAAWSTRLSIYDTNNGTRVRLLMKDNLNIIKMLIHPNDPKQVIFCDNDGVTFWNFDDEAITSFIPVHKLENIFATESALCILNRSNSNLQFHIYNYDDLKTRNHTPSITMNLSSKIIAVSPNRKFMVEAFNDSLYIYNLEHENPVETKKLISKTSMITSCKFNASGTKLGIVYNSGIIDVFQLDPSTLEVISSIKYRWHHSDVSFEFVNEHNLIAGCSKSIIILWDLRQSSQIKQQTLASKIDNIAVSPNGLRFAVSLRSKSTIVMLSADFHQERVFKGLTRDKMTDKTSAFLVSDPRYKDLVLNTNPGTLQFYDPINDKLVNELEVCPHIGAKLQVDPTASVNLVCFNPSGKYMITVDTSHTTLKFWVRTSKLEWVQTTQVLRAHDFITQVLFHPTKDFAVTLGKDGKFKIWVVSEDSVVCRSVGTYSTSSCNAADFSADGSLLAVSFNETMTLWNPITNTLLEALPSLIPYDDIKFCKFISTNLITCTKQLTIVWNLLTLRPVYSYEAQNVASLSVDLNSERFVITNDRIAVLFSISSNVPVCSWNLNGRISSSVFSVDNDVVSLYFILKNMSLCSVNKRAQKISLLKRSLTSEIDKPLERKKVLSSSKNVESNSRNTKDNSIFDIPAHILPPIDQLYKLFMNSMLLTDNNQETETVQDQKEVNDEEVQLEIVEKMEIDEVESEFDETFFDKNDFSDFFRKNIPDQANSIQDLPKMNGKSKSKNNILDKKKTSKQTVSASMEVDSTDANGNGNGNGLESKKTKSKPKSTETKKTPSKTKRPFSK